MGSFFCNVVVDSLVANIPILLPIYRMNMKTSDSSKCSSKTWLWAIVLLLVIGGGIGAYTYFAPNSQTTQSIATQINDLYKPKVAKADDFATYTETSVKITPQVKPYTVKADLSNVENAKDFANIPDEAKKLLVKNGFAVVPGYSNEFFPLYEDNRYQQIPNFITTDSILHNYHLFFDDILKKLEENKLGAEVGKMNVAMLADATEQLTALKGTKWENAAKRNVGFFAVASKLFDEKTVIPDVVKPEVEKELALIKAHAGITASPVMNIGASANPLDNLKEDYSQYIPRGHYDKTEALKRYFKTMMWYGRLTFRFKTADEVKSATLITEALNKEAKISAINSWSVVYQTTAFFVGKSDDITYEQMSDVVDHIYTPGASAKSLAADDAKFTQLMADIQKLPKPQINSMPIFDASIQPDREKEISGFRFMGQRFTIDAAIFQRLVDREVNGRMLPKGLDIAAAMGSEEALALLKADKTAQTDAPNYLTNMTKLKTYISGLKQDIWTQNLYWGWLQSLLSLTEKKPEGFPSFMQNIAWMHKELNTYLGSWSELRHDTILYVKQTYAEMGGGPGDEVKKDDRGYVEPNPYVYARLSSLLKMTQEGLSMRGLLTNDVKDSLGKMQELTLALKTISEKELNNEKITDKDYELIRTYGGQLEHFWLDVNQKDLTASNLNQRDYLQQNPSAIIADVATDPNSGTALEEGTGKISNIYVVVPVDGKLRITQGGTYSYYEFGQPISDRLTDKKWRDMLDSEKPPLLPSWVHDFVVEWK